MGSDQRVAVPAAPLPRGTLPARSLGYLPWACRSVVVDWVKQADAVVNGRACIVSVANVVQSDGVRSWRLRRYDFPADGKAATRFAVLQAGRWLLIPTPHG